MRDWDLEILRHLENHPERSFKLKELQRALRVPTSLYRQFRAQVLGLAREGRIAQLPRRRFQSASAAPRPQGRVVGVGQRATHVVLKDDRPLPLVEFSSEQVVPGDEVVVLRVREGGQPLARVLRVVEAAPRQIFGTLQRVGDRWVLIPETEVPGFKGGAFLRPEVKLPPEADGELARGVLPAYRPASERPELTGVERLGPEDHPHAAMALRIGRSGWPQRFSEEAHRQAHEPLADGSGRRDLRDAPVFTIDPLTAQDHDDAVEIRVTEDGGFVLGVHIADVAAHVAEGSALDEEAQERATSVYPPGQVLPMLPGALSSGRCSLHHGVDRACVSVRIAYDQSGHRRGIQMGRSWIRSRASLAYEHAEGLLEDPSAPVPLERLEDGADRRELGEALGHMHTLAERLRGRRRQLGSLFLERPEREFVFDAEGHVEDLRLRATLRSHWIIEEFMLEANRAVAESLHAAQLPLLWRVHEEPDERKVGDLVELLRRLGIRWRPSVPIRGRDYGELFEQTRDREEAPLIHMLALRSLMKACYRAGWERHFGLAFSQYTHFTSPIRRYPDLHNQRWIHALVDAVGEGGWIEDALREARRAAGVRRVGPAERAQAHELAHHCSEREREAALIERDCADICGADHLKPHEGEEWEGLIVGTVSSGLFVELDGTGMDGFVGVEQLPGDWYTFDPRRHGFVGQRTGRLFRLGQRVRVLLEHVDVRNGRMWLGSIQPLRRNHSRSKGFPT